MDAPEPLPMEARQRAPGQCRLDRWKGPSALSPGQRASSTPATSITQYVPEDPVATAADRPVLRSVIDGRASRDSRGRLRRVWSVVMADWVFGPEGLGVLVVALAVLALVFALDFWVIRETSHLRRP